MSRSVSKVAMLPELVALFDYSPSENEALAILDLAAPKPTAEKVLEALDKWLEAASDHLIALDDLGETLAAEKWRKWHDQLQHAITTIVVHRANDSTEHPEQRLSAYRDRYIKKDQERRHVDRRPFLLIADALDEQLRQTDSEIAIRPDLYGVNGSAVTWIGEPITLGSFIVERARALSLSRKQCIDLYRPFIEYGSWDTLKASADSASSRRAVKLKEEEAEAIAKQIGRLTGMPRY